MSNTGSRGDATIRARVPLRLGLAGGGTDLSPYWELHGGAVLNTTIDRYAYAFIAPSPDGLTHLDATDLGVTESWAIKPAAASSSSLTLHAGVAAHFAQRFCDGALPPVRVTSYVDAPPGSGLGSSSALVVALVAAFARYLDIPLSAHEIAHTAWQIERCDLGLEGGRQDHYAAAFGGTNFIAFQSGGVSVTPLHPDPAVLNELEAALVVCFSGVSRRSEAIIAEQQRRIAQDASALDGMHRLKADAYAMRQALVDGDIRRMAAVLNRSWEAKRRTAAGISTDRIDALHRAAFAAGAMGGKVSGAGGGGFLMFIVPPERRLPVIRALNTAGGEAAQVHLSRRGAETWISTHEALDVA